MSSNAPDRGIAAAYLQATGRGWEAFRPHLVAAITEFPPATPYYLAWVTALEQLLAADRI